MERVRAVIVELLLAFLAVMTIVIYSNIKKSYEPITVEPVKVEVEPVTVQLTIEIESEEETEETIEEPEVEAKSYTEEDLYYLTHVLTGECQTSPWVEQVLVGSVVLNRVNDKYFGDTIKEVCLEKLGGYIQYASYYDGNAYREPTEMNKEVALWLLENGSQAPANVVFQSQFKQGSGTYCKVNKHYFCYK